MLGTTRYTISMKRILGAVLLMVFLLTPEMSAHAASLYMSPNVAELYPGDTIAIAVRLDTEADECINVVDAVIEYDPALVPVDISTGQSILPLWVEQPAIDAANNRITLAGGIPNGYCGRIQGDPRLTNEVVKIIFQSPGLRIGFGDVNPTSSVRFSDSSALYLNDGKGTKADTLLLGAEVFSHKKPGPETVNEWSTLVLADDATPEKFSITLQKDEVVFGGKYFIVFNTTDKQTGIAHYEVIEEPLSQAKFFTWGRVDAPWAKVRSPYVLKDQTLNSTIRVKALDKAGNEYIATLVPDTSVRTMSFERQVEIGLIGVSVFIMLTILILLIFVFVKRRKKSVVDEEELEEEWEHEEYEIEES